MDFSQSPGTTTIDNPSSGDLWDASRHAWEELNQSNLADNELFKWQELVLKEFQTFVNKEPGQTEASWAVREMQLTSIVTSHKEIPVKARQEIVKSILDDMFSFGPLQALWVNKEISDMQVFIPYDSREDQIITSSSRKGRRIHDGPGFRNFGHAMTWLNRHLAQFGQHYDASKVAMDATFPNGERMNVISGVTGYSKFIRGPKNELSYKFVPCVVITLRRFTNPFTIEQLTNRTEALNEPPEFPNLRQVRRSYKRKKSYFRYEGGMADQATMDYLRIMVYLAKNHIISGSTGVGKTTLANALTGAIPKGTVLIVIEESPEMQPQNPDHVIRIVGREGVFTLAMAMKNTLRMYPDRIFIAEIRDTLAYVFLHAIQAGHDGSSTTAHANSCKDTIEVVTNFAANHESHPPREMIRDILYRRVHTIMHGRAVKKSENIARMFDEVVQLLPDQTMHTVMQFHQVGENEDGTVAGYFEFFGPTDEFVEEMFNAGIPIPDSWGWSE